MKDHNLSWQEGSMGSKSTFISHTEEGLRHHDLVNPYNVAVYRIVSDVFTCDAP